MFHYIPPLLHDLCNSAFLVGNSDIHKKKKARRDSSWLSRIRQRLVFFFFLRWDTYPVFAGDLQLDFLLPQLLPLAVVPGEGSPLLLDLLLPSRLRKKIFVDTGVGGYVVLNKEADLCLSFSINTNISSVQSGSEMFLILVGLHRNFTLRHRRTDETVMSVRRCRKQTDWRCLKGESSGSSPAPKGLCGWYWSGQITLSDPQIQ